MKRFGIFLLLLLSACILNAQDSLHNYVLTRTMLDAAGTSHVDEIVYHDGLGRPFQTVLKAVRNGSPANKNIATLQEYDSAGREWNKWLPLAAGSSDYLSPSSFKSSAPGNYGNDSRPYEQPVYEASPAQRLLEQYGPGAAWYTAGRPVKTEYLLNTNASPLHCIKYGVSDSGTLSGGSSVLYAPNELAIVKTTDEDLNVSYSFTDKQKRTLLVRQMNGGEAYDTYYVYDDKNQLRFVLQPKYQETADLDKYAFQYEYDTEGHCTKKKLPGADYTLYTYLFGRLQFSQDGNQRAQGGLKRTSYKYDNLGRLTERCGPMAPVTIPDDEFMVVTENPELVNHYDKYDFLAASGFSSLASQVSDDDKKYGKGMLTGTEVVVDNSTAKIYTIYCYDVEGRVVKTIRNNLLGGYDKTTTTYTFSGNPKSLVYTHTANGKSTKTGEYNYSYDHSDRLVKVKHILNGTIVTLADYEYDDLGRLQSKSLHGSTANKLTYSYNIRGWLTGINGTRLTQNLYYNTGNGVAKYNGNISSMTWKAGTESTIRGYKFTYDGADRLTSAVYGETTNIGANTNRFSENVTGYDKNGNITGLQRYGQTASSSYGLIDNLAFTLNGNQLNRVDDAVAATAYNNGFEFKDGVKQANEYAYDANGNLTKDLNKGIVDIQYNCLNLPSKVTFSDGNTVDYTYAADGTKLRTVHKIGGTTTTTDYCGDVIYENGVQKLLLTEEGYVTLSDSKYHYYLQDHQGNNRVVINQSGTVEETNHYYPFGGVFASSSSVQPYKYNGKEYDNKKGLNWYDYGARHYDAAIVRFTTADPMAEKYYPLSSYTYCGNNPIIRTDPNGMDWYRIKKDDEDEWEYCWDPDIHSQTELNKSNNAAFYLGKTYTEGNTYYSLFGQRLEANSFEGNIYQKVDKAIISTQRYKQEMKTYTGGEDIKKPQIDFSIKGIEAVDSKYMIPISDENIYKIRYEGSATGIYRVVKRKDLMRAYMHDWIGDPDMPKPIGGWQRSKEMYHMRFLNKSGLEILWLQFEEENANILLQKYQKLFSK